MGIAGFGGQIAKKSLEKARQQQQQPLMPVMPAQPKKG